MDVVTVAIFGIFAAVGIGLWRVFGASGDSSDGGGSPDSSDSDSSSSDGGGGDGGGGGD